MGPGTQFSLWQVSDVQGALGGEVAVCGSGKVQGDRGWRVAALG